MSSREGIEEIRWVGALLAMAIVATLGALVVGSYVGVPTAGIITKYAFTIFLIIPLVLAIALFVYMVRAAMQRVPDPLADRKSVVELQSV
jgi:hypothetical protein